MLRLALRQLQLDRGRTLLMLLVIGAVIGVVLILRGFEQGLYLQSREMVLGRRADLFVVQAGVANFVAVRSSLRQLARAEVEAVKGVRQAHPVTAFPVIYEQAGKQVPIYVLVYQDRGGPKKLRRGRLPHADREAVIDRALAESFGISVGDPLILSEFEFRVSGISDKTSAFFMPFIFISYDGMLEFIFQSEIAPDLSTFPLVSFLLVELDPGAGPNAVKVSIETNVSDVDVWTPQQLAYNDEQMGSNLFGPVLGLLIGLAYVVGFLVVGLIVYAEVHGRLRDFGVLKALGLRLSQLVSSIILQTLILLLVAFPLGVFIAWGTAACIEWIVPLYRVPILDPSGLVRTLVACMVFSVLGGLIPLRLVASADPMIAFKGG